MLTGKTQAQSITGFAERTQGKLIFILLQLTVPKRLGHGAAFRKLSGIAGPQRERLRYLGENSATREPHRRSLSLLASSAKRLEPSRTHRITALQPCSTTNQIYLVQLL